MYQEDVLQGVVKHLNMTFFSGQEWVLKQDSAAAQNAKTTQEWLQRNLLAFVSAEDWPSGSADLKTLDNKLWAVLHVMACRRRCNSLESLRRSLVKAASPWSSGVPRVGGLGCSNPPPPRNSEVLTKLSRIPSSVENTSVTT